MSKQDMVPPRKLQSAVFKSTRSDLIDKDDLDDEARLNESRPDLSIGQDEPDDVYIQSNYIVPPPSAGITYTTGTASQSYPCVGTNSYYHNNPHPATAYSTGVTAVPESAYSAPGPVVTPIHSNHYADGQYSTGIHPEAPTETKPAPQVSSSPSPPAQPAPKGDVMWCGTKRWIAKTISVVIFIAAVVAGGARIGSDDKAPDRSAPISPVVRIPTTPAVPIPSPATVPVPTPATVPVPTPMVISVPAPVPTPPGTLIAPGDTYCEAAESLSRTNYARYLEYSGCSCGVALACGECVAGVDSGGVSCRDGCIYTSGAYSVQRYFSSTYGTVSGAATAFVRFGVSHEFTQGAQGSFFYTYDGVINDDLSIGALSGGKCTFSFNGFACGCQQYFCDETKTTYADTIDCSALEGGAVINLCFTPQITSFSSPLEILFAVPTLCLG
jgi:hypothetical protein